MTTFKAKAWGYIEKALCRWPDHNRSRTNLQGKGQQAVGFGSNPVEHSDDKCGLRHCKILYVSVGLLGTWRLWSKPET